ncbi:MAG: MFS transporter [Anaerolineae bacterium]
MSNIQRLTLISFILFMARGLTGPLNSLYMEALGAGYVIIGVLGTVTAFTSILFSYIWGRASDRTGSRKIYLVGGVGVLALSYALIAAAPQYLFLFPLLFISAAAQAAYMTTSLALMGDLLESHAAGRGRRMGRYRGLGSLGFGLMALVAGSIADRWTLRAPFLLAAVLLAGAFVLALRVGERAYAVPTDKRSPSPEALATSRINQGLPLLPLLIASFLWSLVIGAVYAVWANYMVTEQGYAQATMSRLWALASLSEFPLMMLTGRLSDRIGRLPMLALGCVAWALVFVGYVVVPQQPWIVGVQLLRGFAYAAFTAAAMTYAAEVRERTERGRASGLYNASGGLGSIVGSTLGGVQTRLLGFRSMLLTNAAVIFAGALYLTGASVHYRSKSPSVDSSERRWDKSDF